MGQLLIALFLLFSTIVDGQIILDEPVKYPSDFYDLYDLVENQEIGWVFEYCEPEGFYLDWNTSVALFKHTEKQFEDRAFGMLIILFFAPKEYKLEICGDEHGKPILYGQGVHEFLEWYVHPAYYEQERLPIIVEGIIKNITKAFHIFGMR